MSQKTYRQIHEKAMRLLAMREHSCLELQQKLNQCGFDRASIQTVLTELVADNLQSDERYATSYCRLRSERGYGPLAITRYLKEKGISDEVIQHALPQGDDTWESLARLTREKKFGEDSPVDLKMKAKQMRFLQYRGFTHTQIRFAIAQNEK